MKDMNNLTEKNDAKIIIDLNAQQLYLDGEKFNIQSCAFNHSTESILTKLEVLVDFENPIIGEIL